MSKAGSGKSSKGGSSKGSSGCVGETTVRSKALKTNADNLVTLRSALRSADGRDRDVSAELLPMLLKYEKNGLDLNLRFFTGTSVSKELRQFMFKLAKKNTKAISDGSGYGWDDDEYKEALKLEEERYLVAFAPDGISETPVAFVNFEFTVQGALVDENVGQTSLVVMDLQLQKAVQRKGLGRHLLSLMQLVAKKVSMSTVACKVFVNDKQSIAFMESKMPGFAVSYEYVPEGEPLEVWEKSMLAPAKPAPASSVAVGSAADPEGFLSGGKAKTPSKGKVDYAKESAVSPPTSPGEEAPAASAERPTAEMSTEELAEMADKIAARKKGKEEEGNAEPAAPMTAAEKKKARKKAQKARKKEADKAAAEAGGGSAEQAAAAPSPAPAPSAKDAKPLELDSAFKNTIKLNIAPVKKAEPEPAAVLSLFYAKIAKEEKTDAQIADIIEKRQATANWWPTLCGKLAKKYGSNPLTVFEQSQAAEAAAEQPHVDTPRPLTPAASLPAALEADITFADLQAVTTAAALNAAGEEEEEPAEDVDVLLEELMDLFKEQNGRDPTDVEVQQWMRVFREMNEESTREDID